MYERQLSFFLDRIWISCRIGIWYPPHNFGSVAELSSHMTLLHHPAKRVALSRWHLKESWFWVSALILIGVRISGSLSFLTYVHWLPCNALWRGGYLHGSNFVNLATPTTPRHQLPGLPSNQTDFAQFEFTTVQLWSSHCKTEPPPKQTVCTVTDCQGIFVENIAMEM